MLITLVITWMLPESMCAIFTVKVVLAIVINNYLLISNRLLCDL